MQIILMTHPREFSDFCTYPDCAHEMNEQALQRSPNATISINFIHSEAVRAHTWKLHEFRPVRVTQIYLSRLSYAFAGSVW
jgi:hypothetical protein